MERITYFSATELLEMARQKMVPLENQKEAQKKIASLIARHLAKLQALEQGADPEELVSAYPNAIMNVHPALIPSFCGPGYYGLHVHEAALHYGVKLSGATVHFVSEECDGGPIIAQKSVPVMENDTPETLQRRIMEQAEWKLLPEAVSLFCQGRLSVEGRTVMIKEK